MRHSPALLLSAALVLAAAACSKSHGSAKRYLVSGVSQKGPFVTGTEVTVQELDAHLQQTGQSFQGQITDDTGDFTVAAALSSPFVEVIATGFYFDEVSNNVTAAPLTLRAIASVAEGTTVNVNVLTTLEAGRIATLVSAGTAFVAAETQAEGEALHAFGIHDTTGVPPAETLDETGSGAPTEMLLALSAVMQNAAVMTTGSGGQVTATLTQLLAQGASDLKTGSITTPSLAGAISRSGRYIDAASIRANLQQRYASLGDSISIPDFSGYLDRDGSGTVVIEETNPAPALAFTSISTLSTAYGFAQTVLLQDGQILIAGGETAAAQLFDPTQQSSQFLPPMSANRYTGASALLDDGRVLLAGGGSGAGMPGAGTAELFLPGTAVFTTAFNLATVRWQGLAATTLADGRVLIVGGSPGFPAAIRGEVFDPTTDTFALVGSCGALRFQPTTTLLADGKVLIAGGGNSNGTGPANGTLASAELFDPGTNTFAATGSMAFPRSNHTATLLPDGRVLMVGGYDGATATDIATAEIYDPASGTFAASDFLATPRAFHAAVPVAGGKVAIVGGLTDPAVETPVASIELFDIADGLFSEGPANSTASGTLTAVSLSNGAAAIIATIVPGSGTGPSTTEVWVLGTSGGGAL